MDPVSLIFPVYGNQAGCDAGKIATTALFKQGGYAEERSVTPPNQERDGLQGWKGRRGGAHGLDKFLDRIG